MNLRDLHYFLVIASTRSFKRASEQCHISQPTLSMQIKKLEEYLGVRLFERTNKNVMITDVGKRIAEIAAQIVENEQHIYDIARDVRDPSAGDFILGAIPTLASYIFPHYMPALATDFPKLHILLVEEKTDRLIEQLKTGKIDAALLALPVDDTILNSVMLFDDPFLLAVSTQHALAAKKTLRLDNLAGHKLLLLDEGHCLRDQALSVCHTHGAEEEQSFRATSLETLRLMVQADSTLMTLMPRIAASENNKLRFIPFVGTKPSRHIGLVYRKTSIRHAMIVDMADRLRAVWL